MQVNQHILSIVFWYLSFPSPFFAGIHYIHLFWSDTPLTNSPFQGYATSGVLDPSKVILTGRGLKEAIVREEAEFMIDASQAGTGKLGFCLLECVFWFSSICSFKVWL